MDSKKQTKQHTEEEEILQAEPLEKDSEEKQDDYAGKEVEEWKAKYMRALADYQNLEKRNREERSEWVKSSSRQILLKLLPVFDTLELASKHNAVLPAGRQDQNILITIAQFQDALRDEGVRRIDTKNKKFDPAIMEAIQTVDGEEGKVVEEVRAGFLLHDKLLRAAEVTVGKSSS